MPRAFTEEERREARAALVAAARRAFAREGYRGANVAAIAREAGIGKGTVYLFFASKAELFVAVLEEVEREMRAALLEEVERPFRGPRARLEHFLRALLTRMVDHPLLWIVVDPEEAPALLRDLGPEAERLTAADEGFFVSLVSGWREAGRLGPVEPDVLAGACRALYAVSLHRDLVGEAYPAVVDLLVAGLARELGPDP